MYCVSVTMQPYLTINHTQWNDGCNVNRLYINFTKPFVRYFKCCIFNMASLFEFSVYFESHSLSIGMLRRLYSIHIDITKSNKRFHKAVCRVCSLPIDQSTRIRLYDYIYCYTSITLHTMQWTKQPFIGSKNAFYLRVLSCLGLYVANDPVTCIHSGLCKLVITFI